MALVKKQMSRKKLMILMLLLAVTAVGGVYYLFIGSSAITQPTDDPNITRLRGELSELQQVNVKFLSDLESLFDDARFNELKQYGSLPVEVGVKGRINPFRPF